MRNPKISRSIAKRTKDVANSIETFDWPRRIINAIRGVETLTNDAHMKYATMMRDFNLSVLDLSIDALLET
ncbi:MAG: hypothetical protein ACW99U_16945 [Candidatus Thorarchaeota archaeon]|jgi:hypothetical protein